jgi:cytochrome P450
MDLIDDYAFPLPIMVICELLGVPASDRAQFRSWSNAVVTGEPITTGEPVEAWRRTAFADFSGYVRALFARKRADPRDDLVSELVGVHEEGDALSEEELLGTVFLLIVAGHETTVNFIGNSMLALFAHPDQLRMLMRDPGLVGDGGAAAIQRPAGDCDAALRQHRYRHQRRDDPARRSGGRRPGLGQP